MLGLEQHSSIFGFNWLLAASVGLAALGRSLWAVQTAHLAHCCHGASSQTLLKASLEVLLQEGREAQASVACMLCTRPGEQPVVVCLNLFGGPCTAGCVKQIETPLKAKAALPHFISSFQKDPSDCHLGLWTSPLCHGQCLFYSHYSLISSNVIYAW